MRRCPLHKIHDRYNTIFWPQLLPSRLPFLSFLKSGRWRTWKRSLLLQSLGTFPLLLKIVNLGIAFFVPFLTPWSFSNTKIFVNGCWVGIHCDPEQLMETLRKLRRQMDIIVSEVSMVRDIREKEVRVSILHKCPWINMYSFDKKLSIAIGHIINLIICWSPSDPHLDRRRQDM